MSRTKPGNLLWTACVVLSSILIFGALPRTANAAPVALTIFHADSLKAYIDQMISAFHKTYPNVAVRPEGMGSLDAIREVTQLHQPGDILITADWRLLLKRRPRIDHWVMIFAGNSMGLLYTPRSKYANQINADNWYDVIRRPGVRYGHSNPAQDPAGYWTLILWQLAQRYYHKPGLAAKLAEDCPPSNIRPHDIFLIALLQSGDLDYYFGFRSDALLGRLKFLALPDAINLGKFADRNEYSKVSVEFKNGARTVHMRGAAIGYGATLISDSAHPKMALQFLKLMAGPEGRRIAAHNGLIAFTRAYAVDPDGGMPMALKKMTRVIGLK